MKALMLSGLLWVVLAGTGFGRIGENEKEIEARYGKPGKDLGTTADVHQVGYISDGFLILVSFVKGVSERESFANPDTSPITPEAAEKILIMSAIEGTKWEETAASAGDRSWRRSDRRVVAVLPTQGKFLSVQDVDFVQPKS